MQYLKADTNVEVLIGPAVAVGDGFTPVTTLSLSTADEAEIIKHNGATALTVTSISGNTMAAITSADGYYTLDITTGNVDTEGPLTILINDDSLILPIRQDYMVVNANVYDSLFAAATTDYLQVDTLQLGGATQSATDLKDFADAGYDPATNKVQGVVLTDTVTTLTGHTAQTGNTYALANGATGFAAIDTVVDTINTNVGTAGAGLTNINLPNQTMDITGNLSGSVGSVTGLTASNLDATVSSRMATTHINATAGAVDTVTTNTDMRGTDNAATATALATAQTDLDTLTGTDGATLATAQANYAPAKAGDSMDVLSISGSATAADNLELSALTIIPFTVTGTPTSTEVAATGLTATTGGDDTIIGRVIIFTSGNAQYEAARITDYVDATGAMTVTTLAVTPSATDTGIII